MRRERNIFDEKLRRKNSKDAKDLCALYAHYWNQLVVETADDTYYYD